MSSVFQLMVPASKQQGLQQTLAEVKGQLSCSNQLEQFVLEEWRGSAGPPGIIRIWKQTRERPAG